MSEKKKEHCLTNEDIEAAKQQFVRGCFDVAEDQELTFEQVIAVRCLRLRFQLALTLFNDERGDGIDFEMELRTASVPNTSTNSGGIAASSTQLTPESTVDTALMERGWLAIDEQLREKIVRWRIGWYRQKYYQKYDIGSDADLDEDRVRKKNRVDGLLKCAQSALAAGQCRGTYIHSG